MTLEEKSQTSLNTMLDAVKRDVSDYFRMGKVTAKKKLDNGAVVTITIVMPNLKTKKR